MTEVDDGARLLELLQIMRGFPPLQIFLLGLAFGLLAVPLVQLTGEVQPTSTASADLEKDSAQEQVANQKVEALIRLRYAHRPVSLSLKQEGRELLKDVDLATSPIELSAELAISPDGNELTLQAQWPDGTQDTAVTLEIEPDGLDSRTETRWSAGNSLEEILTLIW